MQQALTIIKDLTGEFPSGWYTGRNSPNTPALVAEQQALVYDSDNDGDELPFWTQVACAKDKQ